MKIWCLKVDTGKRDDAKQYQLVNKENTFLENFEQSIYKAEKLNGKLDNIQAHVIHGRRETDLSILWNGCCLYLVNERGKEVLKSILDSCVEFIPIESDEKRYLLNILSVLDALDMNKVEGDSFNDILYYIKKFSFISEKLSGVPAFKVMLYGDIYEPEVFVSEEFKRVVEENKLTGFDFQLIGEF